MSHESAFDSIIIQALPVGSRLAFVRQLWAPAATCTATGGNSVQGTASYSILSGGQKGGDCHIDYEAFFEYYLNECTHALRDRGEHVSVRTHRDILDIAELLKNPANTPPDSPVTLKHAHVDNKNIHGSIDLVARLLTMTKVGSDDAGLGPRDRLAWTDGSLSESVSNYFDKTPTLTMKAVQLEKVFNAQNLQRFTGMQIEWTDNLADHLRMCEFEKKIRVFHHVTFLENHRSGIIPQTLIDETLKTIDLLFPSSDPKVKLWYEKHRFEYALDPKAADHGSLRSEDRIIDNFRYWKDRICILKQEFDEGTPKTFQQWWYDRRSGPQWYTFWIAIVVLILTIFFGVVQSIEGALQVWKAFQTET
ncbi:hypothetical protein B0J12DRAFT_560714 [Macrophomina phaseolina]|uniref:Mg2+ transporter protein CorA-like/Zinc transport protein ZntB n=1 Tax=Macrophomina phaseolina TaxID=35725 RepID=A0ABQ8GXX0_9PEZI|nr:hypothetical protein B0J12DRAFT_560714 [Macrophomina phaseolina]